MTLYENLSQGLAKLELTKLKRQTATTIGTVALGPKINEEK
jgi:hypothetical protein